MKLFVSLMILILSSAIFAQSLKTDIHIGQEQLKKAFTAGINGTHYPVDRVFRTDSELNASVLPESDCFTFNGKITLNSGSGWAMIVLKDRTGKEYLMFDSVIMGEHELVLVSGGMETLRLKEKVKPEKILIRCNDATVVLSSISAGKSLKAVSPDIQHQAIADELNRKIKKQKASWVAEETDVARYSYDQKRAMAGNAEIIPPENAKINYFYKPMTVIPAYYDLRNIGGKDWTSPVKNQGSAGTCWAFCAVGTFEGYINKYRNDPDFDIDLAEAWPVYRTDGGGGINGGDPGAACRFFCNIGVMTEEYFPYVIQGNYPNSVLVGSPKTGYQDNMWKGTSVQYFSKADNIKAALLQYGTLGTSYTVYSDFYNYRSGIYKHVSGSSVGGHAVVVVGWGYDTEGAANPRKAIDKDLKSYMNGAISAETFAGKIDNYFGGASGKLYWICKNSWGANWGENGFFRIYAGEAGICSYAIGFSGDVTN